MAYNLQLTISPIIINQCGKQPRENEGTETEAQGVGRDMLCPGKLFLDERKSLF